MSFVSIQLVNEVQMKYKLEELQAESEALRERLQGISEQLKLLALERFSES